MGLGSVSSWRWHRTKPGKAPSLPQERKSKPKLGLHTTNGWKTPHKPKEHEIIARKRQDQQKLGEYL